MIIDETMTQAECGHDTIPGVLTGVNDNHGVQKCDECSVYPSDLDAALALAKLVRGGTVRYYQHSGDDDAVAGEPATYDGIPTDDIIAPDTDPWVEDRDGNPVDWSRFRFTGATVTPRHVFSRTEIELHFEVDFEVPDMVAGGRKFRPDYLRVAYHHAHDGNGWAYALHMRGPRRLVNGKLGASDVSTWSILASDEPAWARDIALANMPAPLYLGDKAL